MRTGTAAVDAERAFAQAIRARRRAELGRRLRRRPAACDALEVHEDRLVRRGPALGRVCEIPLDAITGTLEPARATLFDRRFRPRPSARPRWTRVWLAEQRGAALPPIAVVRVGDRFAVRDGHHRVSVARARGATMIDAVVE